MPLPEFPESRAMPATLLARAMPQIDISGERCFIGDLRELRSWLNQRHVIAGQAEMSDLSD